MKHIVMGSLTTAALAAYKKNLPEHERNKIELSVDLLKKIKYFDGVSLYDHLLTHATNIADYIADNTIGKKISDVDVYINSKVDGVINSVKGYMGWS